MWKNVCVLLFLFCAIAGQRIPPVPKTRVGPFDETVETESSPQGGTRMFEGDIEKGNTILGNAGSLNPWPNAVIPYRFDCSVENIPSAITATKEAMRVWESKTCVRFVQKRPEDLAYLEFFRSSGCWATRVGYAKDAKTQISIGSGCDYKHVMVHELGHVIGFWHEQSRKDRDNYITIQYSNVIPALRYNFNIVRELTSNYGQSYDYGSIMHYPWNAFAIRRSQPTIIATRPVPTGIRPYVKLSDIDALQTNTMYKCYDVNALRGVQVSLMKASMSLVGSATAVGSKCSDQRDVQLCRSWAEYGQCDTAADPMLRICRKTCGNCGPCEDQHEKCEEWGNAGECGKNPSYMLKNCKVACGICMKKQVTERPCVDENDQCKAWSDYGYCKGRHEDYMSKNCQKSCKICGGTVVVVVTERPCVDEKNQCKDWSDKGYCVGTYKKYMSKNCQKSCKICGGTDKTTPSPTTPTTQMTTPSPTTPTTQMPNPKLTMRRLPNTKFTGTRCEDRSVNCAVWRRDGRCQTERWVMDNCLLSCERFDICDKNEIKPLGACSQPLGVGWDNTLRNRNFFATSIFSPGGGWTARAYAGRLYLTDEHTRKEIGAWCASPRSKNQYLQIDLGAQKTITAVATQGRDRYFEHVKSYSLSFSNDKRNWVPYQENRSDKIFDGNCDHFTPVLNLIDNPPVARYIRFHPIKYIGAMCLRVEVYGC